MVNIRADLIRGSAHVSLDFWGTIVSPNKQFAEARTKYLSNEFGIETEKVRQIFSKVKEEINKEAMYEGKSESCRYNYVRLIAELNCDTLTKRHREIKSGVEALFWKYPPILPKALPSLLMSFGKNINILSNSSFISGSVIQEFIESKSLPIKFTYFSDIELFAKPNLRLFIKMAQTATEMQTSKNPITRLTDIVHIGNDYICDINGATVAGLSSIKVENPDDLATLLVEAQR